jgi:hypothetical protein
MSVLKQSMSADEIELTISIGNRKRPIMSSSNSLGRPSIVAFAAVFSFEIPCDRWFLDVAKEFAIRDGNGGNALLKLSDVDVILTLEYQLVLWLSVSNRTEPNDLPRWTAIAQIDIKNDG